MKPNRRAPRSFGLPTCLGGFVDRDAIDVRGGETIFDCDSQVLPALANEVLAGAVFTHIVGGEGTQSSAGLDGGGELERHGAVGSVFVGKKLLEVWQEVAGKFIINRCASDGRDSVGVVCSASKSKRDGG